MDDYTDIDPEELPEFTMPAQMLEQLYSFTGNGEDTQGLIVAFVAQNGAPAIISRHSSSIVDMGLRKALEQYLEDMEKSSSSIDLGLNSEDND
jgi:hypothetical protein